MIDDDHESVTSVDSCVPGHGTNNTESVTSVVDSELKTHQKGTFVNSLESDLRVNGMDSGSIMETGLVNSVEAGIQRVSSAEMGTNHLGSENTVKVSDFDLSNLEDGERKILRNRSHTFNGMNTHGRNSLVNGRDIEITVSDFDCDVPDFKPTSPTGYGRRIRKPNMFFQLNQQEYDCDDPGLNEALLTPERVRRGDGYETSDTFSDAEESRNESDGECVPTVSTKVPVRNFRKKSVMPVRQELKELSSLPSSSPRRQRKEVMLPLDRSPSNSVTSINSISSLLKEKLVMMNLNRVIKHVKSQSEYKLKSFVVFLFQMMNLNRVIKHVKSQSKYKLKSFVGFLFQMMNLNRVIKHVKSQSEYKLKSFVVFLFLVISLLVGFAHVLYQQHSLQIGYFERLRFNRDTRQIRVHSLDHTPIALGFLGVGLRASEKVYPCLEQDQLKDTVCMEWIHKARFYLKAEKNQSDLRCYRITWLSLPNSSYDPTDCFEEGGTYGHWYGGGRTLGMSWPVELGRVEMSPFVTGYIGRQRWGATLRRYFLSSTGVAILVDPDTSLYVSINDQVNPHKLCLQAKKDDFVGINAVDNKEIDSLLVEPVYQIAALDQNLTEATVQNYTENIIALGFLKQGHVLLNEHWQPHVGDFKFDPVRFSTINDTIRMIHRRGFRITLSIQPFIETESENFPHTVKENMLITERGSNKRVPALTRYKSLLSAGMFDVTSNKTVHWLQSKLRQLVADYNIDSFFLDLGTAYDMPRYHSFKRNMSNPDEFKTQFVNHLIRSVNISGLSGAIYRPPTPVFVSLPVLPSSWESLQLIIPTTLTYGIIGYPFLLPGPVGGDYSVESTDPSKEAWLPDKELYIRWLQLSTFLPVIRYSHLPSEYTTDKMVLDLARNLTRLRENTINELLLKYKKDALHTGAPLIRPLWMLDPTDSNCYTVSNEFLIGEELLVAPILNPDTFERELYLPAGFWRDGIDGSKKRGPITLPRYRVQLHEIAYFRKIPENPAGVKRVNPTA
ncbi:hypothetical protein WDU94_010398 [Cyamophila willieti]